MPGNRVSRLAAMICSTQHVRAGAHLPQPRQHRRHLDAREAILALARVAHGHRQRQRQVADVRERVRRVDRERRQDREDLVQEALAQLQPPFRAFLVRHDADVLLRELVAHLEVRPRVGRLELQHPVPDLLQHLGGGQAVGRRPGVTRGDLLLEARDADLEELVEVAGEDGQEAGALQQRVPLVLRPRGARAR